MTENIGKFTLVRLNDVPRHNPPDPNVNHDFGAWHYSARSRTLTCARGLGYGIDLEEIHTSAEMLDWIFHIHNKTWGRGTVVADLVLAFQELFHPQANLCSLGQDHRLPPGFLCRKRAAGTTKPTFPSELP